MHWVPWLTSEESHPESPRDSVSSTSSEQVHRVLRSLDDFSPPAIIGLFYKLAGCTEVCISSTTTS